MMMSPTSSTDASSELLLKNEQHYQLNYNINRPTSLNIASTENLFSSGQSAFNSEDCKSSESIIEMTYNPKANFCLSKIEGNKAVENKNETSKVISFDKAERNATDMKQKPFENVCGEYIQKLITKKN